TQSEPVIAPATKQVKAPQIIIPSMAMLTTPERSQYRPPRAPRVRGVPTRRVVASRLAIRTSIGTPHRFIRSPPPLLRLAWWLCSPSPRPLDPCCDSRQSGQLREAIRNRGPPSRLARPQQPQLLPQAKG